MRDNCPKCLKLIFLLAVLTGSIVWACVEMKAGKNLYDNNLVVIIAIVQMFLIEGIFYMYGYYEYSTSVISNIIDFVLSCGIIVLCTSNIAVWILSLISFLLAVYVFINTYLWRNKCSSPVKKHIYLTKGSSGTDEIITISKIVKNRNGELEFKDSFRQKRRISCNMIEKISYCYEDKFKLVYKLESFRIDNKSIDGEWYKYELTKDWIQICRWNGEHMEIRVYPRENVKWSYYKVPRYV